MIMIMIIIIIIITITFRFTHSADIVCLKPTIFVTGLHHAEGNSCCRVSGGDGGKSPTARRGGAL